MTKGYSLSQVLLHWIVALLVLLQFLDNDAIGAAWRAVRRGEANVPDGFLVSAHVFIGIAVLALAALRILLRVVRGAPKPPEHEPRILQLAGAASHGLLYLLLLLLPISGLVAWYGGVVSAGEVHEVMTNLLIALVVLHVAGALYQLFYLRSDVAARMIRVRAE
jgi:cytochrome b561